MKELAPIVLFVYNRPEHAEKTIKALSHNLLADKSLLFVYCDGPKQGATADQLLNIEKCRNVARNATGFAQVQVIERHENKGLADSIVEGVTSICKKYKKVIVLEDDIYTSPFFLKFMNEALDLYEHDDRVKSISGYMYPHNKFFLPDTFFCQLPLCWGWATWDRAWNQFNGDSTYLLQELENRNLWEHFNVFGGNFLGQQLYDNISGKIKTWFIKWHASVVLQDGLTLFPCHSYVQNIGMDNSGQNCSSTNKFVTSFANDIQLKKRTIKESKLGRSIMYDFYQGHWYNKRRRTALLKKVIKILTGQE